MLTITDCDNTFFDEDSFTLNSVIFLEESNGRTTSFNFSIDKLNVKYTPNSKQSYKNGVLTLINYQLQIQSYTEINLNECTQ